MRFCVYQCSMPINSQFPLPSLDRGLLLVLKNETNRFARNSNVQKDLCVHDDYYKH